MENKINVYRCPLGHSTITKDVDEGVTPFMLGCRHPGCQQHAQSSMYRVDQTLTAEYEWFKPATLNGYSAGMVEHIKQGGLVLRKVGEDSESTPVNKPSFKEQMKRQMNNKQ